MTKKKNDNEKLRNPKQTPAEIMDTAVAVLNNEGHLSMTYSSIGKNLEKHQSLITHYFKNTAGLFRELIEGHDNWKAMLEKHSPPENPSPDELAELFISLSKENFHLFLHDQTMRSIFKWQLYDPGIQLRAIAEDREDMAAGLLDLADSLFSGTDVDFRVVFGLIIYGTYHMVLHSKVNKSNVAGINLNLERDQEMFAQTITLIIKLCFSQAEAYQKIEEKTVEVMQIELGVLEKLLAEGGDVTEECNRLRQILPGQLINLKDEAQINTWLYYNMYRLVQLCNLVYDAGREDNVQAECIQQLIRDIKRPVRCMLPGAMLVSRLFCHLHGGLLWKDWLTIKDLLEANGSDALLIEIVYLPFIRFKEAEGEMVWRDYTYLLRYAEVLREAGATRFSDPYELIEVLIGLGYNHVRFFNYCTDLLESKLMSLPKSKRQLVLNKAKDRLAMVNMYSYEHYNTVRRDIQTELYRMMTGISGA